MPPPTDADLAAAARAGDRAAFGTLVERHQAALLRTCRRALGDPAAAAEVAQEAVLQALSGLPGLRDDGAFGPWLCGIGHNLARRTRRTPAPLPLEAAPEPAAPGPPDREDGARVLAAIAALPPGQRDAVALFYLADLSHAQISARLGISTGAVKTRLHKARSSLQARLADLRRELPAMTTHRPHARRRHPRHRRRRPALQPRRPARGATPARGACRSGSAPPRPPRSPPASTTSSCPRPDTYRFAADLLDAAGAQLREVRIVRLAETIFYAQAVLEDGASVDARPSDAINLALVTGAPVLVEEAVLAQAADERARDRRGAGRGARLAPRRPRDRRRAQESRKRRMSGRPNHSPRIAAHTSAE